MNQGHPQKSALVPSFSRVETSSDAVLAGLGTALASGIIQWVPSQLHSTEIRGKQTLTTSYDQQLAEGGAIVSLYMLHGNSYSAS